MKKRLFSILLALCMVLCLVPTTAFAESETEEPPVCTCETACTAEAMNTECPVCGAVGALPESCAKCSGPVEDAAAEPEVEDNEAQPEASPVVLSGKREIKSEAELNVALGDKSCTEITLGENIELSGGYIISHTVTLDLNGYTLTVNGNEWDIFSVYESGNLTVKDSGTGGKIDGQNKNCGFCIYGGVLTLESGTIINCMTDGDGSAVDISSGDSEGVYGKFVMNGGAITNCKATDDGGAVDIGKGCTFIMNSGTISGCRADDDAGAIFIKGNASFVMNGGTIENCSAGFCGGAVKIRNTSRFTMNGGTISSCTAQQGGGVYVDDSSTFNMNGGSIANCTAVNGGNSVFVMSGTGGKFTMTDGTVDGSVTLHFTVAGSDVYMDGLGTAAYPYQISTADQLKLFRDIVNGTGDHAQNHGACAVLTNDIVLNDGTFDENGNYTTGASGKAVETWTPIGKYTDDGNNTPYTGTFDGKHYAIKGLYVVNLPDVAVGLFGGLKGAAVRNLTVDGYVQGCDFVSGIAGDASANSTIENCQNDCHVVSEYGADSGSFLYVGGIVGSAADTTIAGCVNTGVVEARGSNNFGSVAAGIVGILYGNATVINCYNTGEINVTGDKLREGTAGGIAGKDLSAHNTVSDCYNVGAVTVEYTGNSDSYIAMVGGIMGKIYYSDTTVSNCYSVGTLKSTTGKGTSYIGGVVGITKGTVANCYYLDSTAEKAVWPDGGTVDEATGPKTAAQLGNGTVLALLINSRTDSEHPWNSQCQYLAAAGKTLPVFKTQTGDEHTHDQSSPWKSNETEHWQVCACGAVFHKAEHSGGTATCTQRAICAVCGAEYGDVLGHDFTTNWTHDDNEHWKQCSRCDKKDDVGPHTWDNGTITIAPTCTKAGEETYSCTKCGATKIEPIPATGHRWKSEWTSDATHHWHECANESCDVTDNAGKNGYAEHSGGKATCTQNAVCEICKAEYGEKLPHDFTAETVDAKYLKSAATCTEKAVYYKSCAVCGLSSEGTADEATFFSGNALDHNWGAWTQNSDEKTHTRICKRDTSHTETENCIDANKDHKCDICDYIISECADDNKDHKCDYCGKKLTEHTGGKATCKDKAKCEVCGAEYGELDAKNHTDLKHFPATAATKTTEGNIEYWYCEGCGKYYSDKDGTKEIKKADTVTAKLKDDSKSPQTGDTSNLALWIALLFVSGGAAIGTTVVSRKKKYNR